MPYNTTPLGFQPYKPKKPANSGFQTYQTVAGQTQPATATTQPAPLGFKNIYGQGTSPAVQDFLGGDKLYNQGSWGMNQGNTFTPPVPMGFKDKLSMGSSFTPAATTPMTAGGGLIGAGNTPAMGSTFTPPPTQDIPMTAGGNLVGPGNTPTPVNSGLIPPPAPVEPPPDMPGYTPMGFSMPQLTMENLQPYMTPYLDQIINRGNENILANASARGHLRSTGLEEQLGGWAAEATAKAWQDAQGAFFKDRGDLFGAYQYADTTGYNRYDDDRRFGYDVYRDQVDDYNQAMGGRENRMAQLASLAPEFAKMGIDLTTDQGQAIALLYLSMAEMQGASTMAAGNANRGLIGDIMGGILGLFGLGG